MTVLWLPIGVEDGETANCGLFGTKNSLISK